LVDLGADRNLHHNVGAACAVTVLAHAATAILGGEMLLVAVVDERVEAFDRERDRVAALAAAAAARSAALAGLLAPERPATVAAVAGADRDLGFVKKFHD